MKIKQNRILGGVVLMAATLTGLQGCHHNEQAYQISVTNITHGQPLSPPVAILHKANVSFWQVGEAATEAIERMAEGGDTSSLVALADASPYHQSDAVIAPGATQQFTLSSQRRSFNRLTLMGMLVNTNDAFSGINGIELNKLKPGQTAVYYSHSYDAGTEFNSELPGTIPGPADGGEGFNAARDDVTSVITLHGGVVSADDAFSASTLSAADRFDNPSLRIVVTAL